MKHGLNTAGALIVVGGQLACVAPRGDSESIGRDGLREPAATASSSSSEIEAQPRAARPLEERSARQVWSRWREANPSLSLLEPVRSAWQALAPADAGTPDAAAESDGSRAAGGASDAGAPGAADAAAPTGGSPVHPGAEVGPEPAPALPDDIVANSELPFHGVVGGERISARGVWRRLVRSRAICLGEQHDDPYHHNLQVRVLEGLARLERARPARRGELAVGYEMIQRPFQAPLSAYVRGELGEAEFIEQTEYQQRWGSDLALYRPLFEANRAQGLEALALNAPTELTRQIGRQGLESLSPELAAQLPELDLADAEHRQFIFGLFGLTTDDPAAASLENIYRAQVTWDEAMAQTASEWLTADDDRRVLAFAGSAHCHESAIPRRLERRTGIGMLSVAPILASELEGAPDAWQGYELLIVLED